MEASVVGMAAATALSVTLGISGCAGPSASTSSTPTASPAAASEATLEVMSFNVNFGIAGDRETLAAVRSEDPDLVLLQETTPAWESAFRGALGDRYPHIAFQHVVGGAGGLGVLSKYPFEERELIQPPDGGWFPAWRLMLKAPGADIQVLNVHLRPKISDRGSVVSGYFTTGGVRESEIAKYVKTLERGVPTLIAGDFNEGRGGNAVGYLEDRGYRSTLGELDRAQSTWHWRTSVGTVSAELDHIAHDERLVPVEARVVEAGHSDHYPVVARFALRRGEVPRVCYESSSC